MIRRHLTLLALPGTLAICRLPPTEAVPAWAVSGPFVSITRTAEELSVVCPESVVPEGVRCERGWRAWRLAGTFDLTAETGVLASVAVPLAEAAIPIFAVSTFDTDYVLVKAADIERAAKVLREWGHEVGQK